MLADASQAYTIARQDAEVLVAEGHTVEAVGGDLDPPKLIVFVPAERLKAIPSRRPLVVRLSVELLAADCLARVRFQQEPDAGR